MINCVPFCHTASEDLSGSRPTWENNASDLPLAFHPLNKGKWTLSTPFSSHLQMWNQPFPLTTLEAPPLFEALCLYPAVGQSHLQVIPSLLICKRNGSWPLCSLEAHTSFTKLSAACLLDSMQLRAHANEQDEENQGNQEPNLRPGRYQKIRT